MTPVDHDIFIYDFLFFDSFANLVDINTDAPHFLVIHLVWMGLLQWFDYPLPGPPRINWVKEIQLVIK